MGTCDVLKDFKIIRDECDLMLSKHFKCFLIKKWKDGRATLSAIAFGHLIKSYIYSWRVEKVQKLNKNFR